jgi:hypothetical protein
MDLLNSYFSDLVFSRIEEKEGFVIYGAGISSGLGGGKKRYILLFVPTYLATKNKSRIYNLKWQNLQAREITHSYNIPMQRWSINRDAKDIILEVEKRDKDSSSYKAVIDNKNIDFPFDILLLHDSKKKTVFQYRNRLTLTAAIELFNCVFNYIGEPQNSYNHEYTNLPLLNNWFKSSDKNIDDSFELV